MSPAKNVQQVTFSNVFHSLERPLVQALVGALWQGRLFLHIRCWTTSSFLLMPDIFLAIAQEAIIQK